ncbi:UNVERIFIED_CONTAM: hypothetical protein RMT77_001918 [Armadillidium vulgare]
MKNEISKCISTIFEDDSLEICEAKWKSVSQTLYDFIKNEEKIFGIPISKEVLPQLFINNMNAEQIWQQIEFQNDLVIAMNSEASPDNPQNLCIKIAQLCNRANDDADEFAQDDDDDEEEIDNDDYDSGGGSGSEAAESEVDDNENIDADNEDSDSDNDSILNLGEIEDAIGENKNKSDEEEEIDFDKDTWGDIALNDDDDDDEEEEEEKGEEEWDEIDEENEREKDNIGNEDRLLPPKNFSTSVVDSKFFNLRQSEWIADNDIIGKSFSENINLMENMDSDEEEENDLMYDNFFDPPPESSEKSNEENASEVEVKSKFAQKLEDESALKKELEEETFLAEKSWTLKGEVQKVDRPENSTLEHHLEAKVAIRMKPVITEEVNKKIEELILTRIKNQSFDSVERKIKPVVDPSQFKQKLILDQEKSTKSLAEIYEEEYLKKQEETKGKAQTVHSVLSEADENHELPIHKEIKRAMKSLFTKLDSLFHYHYTPIYKPPEVKVVKNVQAITIEESTPAIVSDATLLAPQEIVASTRGELKGKTEKDKTDKKRERRSKKKHQKLRARREGTKLRQQLEKRDKNGLMMTNASIKFVQNAVKKGQIQMLDNKQKGMKSSSAFFNEMQNVIANGTKKRKPEDSNFNAGFNKKKKGNKPQTMSKLLL